MNDLEKQVCLRCVMDTSADNIQFDDNGYCNYCTDFLSRESETNNTGLESIIEQIKRDGKGLDYDCIVGVSGGLDSSFLLHKVVEWSTLR